MLSDRRVRGRGRPWRNLGIINFVCGHALPAVMFGQCVACFSCLVYFGVSVFVHNVVSFLFLLLVSLVIV